MDKPPTVGSRLKAAWSGFGHADSALSLLDRFGITKYIGPSVVSAVIVAAASLTEWVGAIGPLGWALVAIGGFIAGCLALATFERWRINREERFANRHTRLVPQPRYEMIIQGGMTGHVGSSKQSSAANVGVLLWNTGEQTHIVEWTMEVRVRDGTRFGQYVEPAPDGMSDIYAVFREIRRDDSFARKRSAVNAEPANFEVMFLFLNPKEVLLAADAVWVVSMRDTYGNTCSAEYEPGKALTSKDLR